MTKYINAVWNNILPKKNKKQKTAPERKSYEDFFVSLRKESLTVNQENLIGIFEFRSVLESWGIHLKLSYCTSQ